jgi:CheY-like chemotaxis protein
MEGKIREANEQLINHNTILQTQASLLKKQKEELSAKNTQIEQANARKSEFMASMSHELRTPLNAIIGFSELMMDGITGDVTEEQKECLDDILNSGRHLLELINDVLDLSKVEAGKMEFHPVDLIISDVIHEAVQSISPLTDQKGHSLVVHDTEEKTVVFADKGKLKQILLNLLSNAVKFTPPGGVIEIAASPLDNDCLISVKDNGIGLREEDLERVFEVFTQAGSVEGETTKGTGLGLPLTRQFLKAMNGKIWAESVYGEGSTFLFTLPLNGDGISSQTLEITEPEPVAPVNPLKKDGKKIVLIIDDDESARKLIKAWLNEGLYEVLEAGNGNIGINTALKTTPDIVLLDIRMPEKDGWAVLQELKAFPSTQNIPVFITSMEDDRELAFNLGANEYFTKPIEKSALLKKLEEAVYQD